MYNVLNIYAQTLCLSRTPRRLKTSCESTSEEAGLARRKTKFKIPFQFPDLSKTACIYKVKIRTMFKGFICIVLTSFLPGESVI
jgi:hypothetical protein